MTALTTSRLFTWINDGPLPQKRFCAIKGGVHIYAGAIVQLDPTNGYVKPASSTAGLVTLGLANEEVDATLAADGALFVEVLIGVFGVTNSAGADAISNLHTGLAIYAVDDSTVALTSNGGTRSFAGHVWYVDPVTLLVQVLFNPLITDVLFSSTAATVASKPTPPVIRQVRCVASAAITIATALVTGQVIDGVTLAAGDRVLVGNQASAGQSGVYIVGAAPVAGTFAPDYVQGSVLAGMVFEASEGTRWANSSWKITAAQATAGGFITVGTTDPIFMPRTNSGVGAVGTVVSNAFIAAASSPIMAIDQTAAASLKAILVAGRGNGTITWTGTGTDVVLYSVVNWG